MSRLSPRARTSALLVALLLVLAPAAWSQRGRFSQYVEPNVPYDGRFTFARIRYTQGYRLAWNVDYPRMERNLLVILDDLASMTLNREHTNVYTLDDPELARYSVAWLTEPGYWIPSEAEALGLRAWLAKGGFLIVDDFYWEQQWDVFERGMRAVLPNARIERLDASHPIFDTFFHLTKLDGMHHPSTEAARAEYYGIYENNDPTARLMVVISFNNDIGDYMEWSGDGYYPVNLSNDAYKFATNFIVYGLTH